jgi:hypothetical protein
MPKDCVLELHKFIQPLLYPRKSASKSRWDHPFECFVALFALREDGTFKAPKDVEGIFSPMFHHIRSVIFYEALITVRKFDGDLLKYVNY